MEERGYQEAIGHLFGSLAIQADASQQRLTLEGNQTLLNRLLAIWLQLDAHEALAATRGQLHQHLRYVRRDVAG